MQPNQSKASLIAQIHEHRSEMTCSMILNLLDLLTLETRIDNDRADPQTVLKNQGKIAAYLELKDCIVRGLPSLNGG